MKKEKTSIGASVRRRGSPRAQLGFSLLELIVAMAVFVTVAGTAFSVFGQHATLANEQQTLSGVNIGLRNGMTQMEMDLSGAGGNLLAGVTNATPFYFSVIINNNIPGTAATCAPTSTWGYPIPSACFDSFTVLSPNNSLAKPCTGAGGTQAPALDIITTAASLSAASTVTADDPNTPGNNTTQTNDASCYKSGDELLFIKFSQITCDVSGDTFTFCMNVVKMTGNATVSGGAINLPVTASGTTTADPMAIVNTGSTTYFTSLLANGYPTGSYIVDLGSGSNAVTYTVMVNPNNSNDQQLVRCPGMSCTTSNAQVVTDQVVGFKVGADLWNNKATGATDIANYIYNAAHYCSDQVGSVDCTVTPPAAYDPYDFTLVRAMRLSLIARTPPRDDPTLSLFKNGFDSGPYLVQKISTVVDLRNLSNVDSTN